MTSPFSAAILTGGASRRMGTDKALVTVDGAAMAVRVARAMHAAGATAVSCIGGDGVALALLGLAAVGDEWPGEGPLGGLATALGWSAEQLVVVAGCDQPWLDGAAIGVLVRAHRPVGSLATVYGVDGRAQPLPGAYDVRLRSHLVSALDSGERALIAGLRLARPTIIELAEPAVLRDVDWPEDLPPR